jgi:potassium inwardly-rectifying channel subfamily J
MDDRGVAGSDDNHDEHGQDEETPSLFGLSDPLLFRGRLLDRDAAFFQSRGRWNTRQYRDESLLATAPSYLKQFWDNWFYGLAYKRTIVLIGTIFVTYSFIVFFFAGIYLLIARFGIEDMDESSGSPSKVACDLEIHSLMEALYFSLSTQGSIGYGVSNYYFGSCWTPLFLVISQMCVAVIFDAVAIGLLFHRFSRGHKRGKTVLFSNTAVVCRVRDELYLLFRIAELRRHQLLEATVRAYCIRQERHKNQQNTMETTHYITKPMEFLHQRASPQILMSLPQTIIHKIDQKSPLYPPSSWYDAHGIIHQFEKNGEHAEETASIQNFFRDRETEIVVIIEGSDELTGVLSQTRHSYTFEEIRWDSNFVSCIFPYESDRVGRATLLRRRRRGTPPVCVIDLAKFHATQPAPLNADSCPHIIE